MSNQNLIVFKNVSKYYYKNFRKSQVDSIFDYYNPFFSNTNLRKGQFECIKNISFQVQRGETLGIVGENGVGKSTILKLILGNIKNDKGTIKTVGNVVPLINLGYSLFPMLNFIENIQYNLNLLNYNQNQIQEKTEKILDFSEIPKQYYNQIIRNYSTGMKMRVAFSLAIFSDPDILLIDEVFSVGDFNFIIKIRKYLSEIKKKTAMVIVSHNSNIISDFADNCLVLKQGDSKYFTKADNAIKFYHKELIKVGSIKKLHSKDSCIKLILERKSKIQKKNINFKIRVIAKRKIKIDNIRFYIKNYSGLTLLRYTIPTKKKQKIILNKGTNKLELKIPDCSLISGEYYCHIAFKEDKIKILSALDFKFDLTNNMIKEKSCEGSIIYQNFKWKFLKNE